MEGSGYRVILCSNAQLWFESVSAVVPWTPAGRAAGERAARVQPLPRAVAQPDPERSPGDPRGGRAQLNREAEERFCVSTLRHAIAATSTLIVCCLM